MCSSSEIKPRQEKKLEKAAFFRTLLHLWAACPASETFMRVMSGEMERVGAQGNETRHESPRQDDYAFTRHALSVFFDRAILAGSKETSRYVGSRQDRLTLRLHGWEYEIIGGHVE